ncbi:MAG: hypothetical protein NVSMB2_24940 [Chloroflexota bacterium]
MLLKLLGAPFSLPGAGMKFIFNTIADLADQELNDDNVLREQLILLQVQYEEGDIDDDEFAEREAELLARLREIKARKRAEAEGMAGDAPPDAANVEARRRFIVETPFDK